MNQLKYDGPAGLPGDPILFSVMTEIAIIAKLGDREFERRMPDGLTVAQFSILNHLLRLDREETIGEIAHCMQVAQPTVSSTVRKLEEKGFIVLKADPADRRLRKVAVTAAGRKARDAAVKAVAPGIDILTAGTQGTDWPAILTALERLRAILDGARG